VALEFIEIDYNRESKPLEAVLSGVKRQGDFFVSGALEMPMPKVRAGNRVCQKETSLLSPPMTPGGISTNGETPVISLWGSAPFLLPRANCYP